MFKIGSSLRRPGRVGVSGSRSSKPAKIRWKYLRALEADQFEVLPGHTYVKASAYADSLGLDGQLYVDEYNSRYVPGEDESAPRTPERAAPAVRRRRRERRESHVVAIALVAIALSAALVIAAWRFGGPEPERVRGLDTAGRPPRVAAGARRATVEIRAVRGDSFMEVRARDRAGRPLYRGTLERGQMQRFPRQRSVYISLGSPDNVVVKLNETGSLPERRGAIVTARGLRDAS